MIFKSTYESSVDNLSCSYLTSENIPNILASSLDLQHIYQQ